MSTPTQIEGNLEDYSFSRDGDEIVVSATSSPENTATTSDNSLVDFNDSSVEISSTIDNAIAASSKHLDESPSLTTLSDGGYVLTWTSWGSLFGGDFDGIKVQRYNADGTLLKETSIAMPEVEAPSVTALADGKFVIAWGAENTNGTSSIYTQQFDASGNNSGSRVLVATTATGREADEATVTVLADGKHLVTWLEERETTLSTELGSALDNYDSDNGNPNDGRYEVSIVDIKGKIYSNGSAGGTLSLYTGNGANGELDIHQVIARGDGSFWTLRSIDTPTGVAGQWDNPQYNTDIFIQQYNASGVAVGSPTTLQDNLEGRHWGSSLSATKVEDGFVVSWVAEQDFNSHVYVQHYDQNFANPQPPTAVIQEQRWSHGASLASLSDGGYLLTWNASGPTDEIYAQRFNANGTPIDANPILVATAAGNLQAWDSPVATTFADNSFVISWHLADQDNVAVDEDENDQEWDLNLYAQRFNAAGEPLGSLITTITGDDGNNTLIWTDTDSVVLVGGEGDDSLQGGSGDDLLDGGAGNDTAVFSGESQSYTLGLNIDGKITASTSTESNTLIDIEQITFSDGNMTVDQGLLALEDSAQVGSETPAVTTLEDGSQVFVWTRTDGLYIERYIGNERQGEGLLVAGSTNAENPSISAIGEGFLVTWEAFTNNNPGFTSSLLSQRFDEGLTPQSEIVTVRTATDDIYYSEPNAVALKNGGYALTWAEEKTSWQDKNDDGFFDDGEISGTAKIYVQLTNADGVAGAPILASSAVDSIWSFEPSIAALNDGGFAITWEYENDATGAEEIHLQRFDSTGKKLGSPVQVNTSTSGDQGDPDITTLGDGSFVVTWTRETHKDISYEDEWGETVVEEVTDTGNIFMQRFSAAGKKMGAETKVNATNGIYGDPSITALKDGGYAITWATSDESEGASESTLYAQIFDKSGTKIGSELIIAKSSENHFFPDITATANGGFLVTWESLEQGSFGSAPAGDIYAKSFDANGNSLTLNGDGSDNTLIWSGSSGATLDGGAGNDHISGANGNDSLIGGAGNDTLNGGAGADSMSGGANNDTYLVDNAKDTVTEEADDGDDTVTSSVTWTLGDNLENLTLTGTAAISGTGNALGNELTGNSAINTLSGADGADILDGQGGADILKGGKGNDTYIVDLTATNILQDAITENLNEGEDTVQLRGGNASLASTVALTLGANLEHLDASETGLTKLNITGNALNNTLTGNEAANILNGGAGADILIGGLGNDTYVVDSAADQIQEGADEGTDLVQVAIATAGGAYTLGDNLENATLTNTVAFNLTGNDADNILKGNAANNRIDGGLGADIMNGGAGNDTYVVDRSEDVITDSAGIDTVEASIAYQLASTLENLTLTGSDAINGTGNALANILDGSQNSAANVLTGLAGNDTYIVGASDSVVEALNGGTDLVKATVDFELDDNLENLSLIGSGNINATGNSVINTLLGNDGNNTLNGQGGADILKGGKGNDTYIVDLTSAGALQDTITELANSATYNGGIDSVLLRGLSNNVTAVTLNLGVNLENLDASATGASKLNLTGTSADNVLMGNDAANILTGGLGNDTLYGGAGNDILIGGSGADLMHGGIGDDTFRFATLGDLGLNGTQDVIGDFSSGDKLDFKALAGYSFKGEVGSFDGIKQLRTEQSGEDLIIYGNSGGDLNADFSIKLLGVTELNGSDFIFS